MGVQSRLCLILRGRAALALVATIIARALGAAGISARGARLRGQLLQILGDFGC